MVPGLASAAGAAGSALLSGAGAVLGSISLPVVAGVLAVGALAYGGYKLYQYLTKKKWNDTEILRMMEYGLRGGDEEAFKKIYALEKMLTDAATVTETDVSVDNKKVKAEEVYKIFGIDPASNDDEQLQRKQMFDVWYEQRFSPITICLLNCLQPLIEDRREALFVPDIKHLFTLYLFIIVGSRINAKDFVNFFSFYLLIINTDISFGNSSGVGKHLL
jgi:hypothetical protein